jgi:hypothetical protein
MGGGGLKLYIFFILLFVLIYWSGEHLSQWPRAVKRKREPVSLLGSSKNTNTIKQLFYSLIFETLMAVTVKAMSSEA